MVEPSKYNIIIYTSTILSNIKKHKMYITVNISNCILLTLLSVIVSYSYVYIWVNRCVISQVIIYLKLLKRWIFCQW